MKISTIILFFVSIVTSSSFSQNTYDTRKVKWGMTKQEVLDTEFPRIPSTNKGNEFQFENIVLGDIITVSATLYYTFTNDRLSEVTYKFNRTYQPLNMTLYEKVQAINPLFDFISKRKMRLLLCWELQGPGLSTYEKASGDNQCGFDKLFLTKVEKVAREKKAYEAHLHYLSDRTNMWIRFNFDNSDNIFKDIIGWATFTPTYSVKKETGDSGF